MPLTQLRCGNCEGQGTTQVLGHIDPEGRVVIKRYHKDSTMVGGDQFIIYCGICGNDVYRKEVNHGTLSRERITWLYRQRIGFGTITAGS